MGNTITINGRLPGPVLVRPGERLRLRLINTANARVFRLRFEDIASTVVALDGQPVTPHPLKDNRVVLGPGMRADLILDVPTEAGGRNLVVDDYYGDKTYDLTTLVREGAPLRGAPPPPPAALPPNPLPEPDLAAAEVQEVQIEGGSKGFLEEAIYKGEKFRLRKLWRKHRKIWTLNGIAAHGMVMEPMFTLKQGRSYRWKIKNDTAWDHPMHLHGHHFRILSRNGKPVDHRPWADTVLLHIDETAEIAFVADNPGDWLFHCHILEHHVGGMAAVIRVG
jgi:FtsP/CotA-like multicopper oxidase with cupredoxin domain